ncbi:N-acetylmuramoyl-L-alanine amidase family protein [Streptococcus parasanguinis]|uniref:N-acetylmuramoyl-L-alanine amidase family protein n=1 Tax=Streptococcus parasanguinis TaxID=1318 RepID=UPI00066D0097|nr:cell wall-binding protein [Streptococcus parasanguinis]
MKKNKLLLASAIVISLLTPMSQVKADWKRDNVGWWYSLNNGSYYKNTGAYIDGKWYRFDDRGYMMTGWQPIAERNATSLKKINWSYFDPVNGDQKIGWQNIDGKWYYLTRSGALIGEQLIDGKNYYFDPVNGDMQTGWVSEQFHYGTENMYFDPVSGALVKGWQNIDGKWYYFQHSALKGSQNLDGKNYYFDPVNCDMQTGWVTREKASATRKYYYDLESGEQLSGWQDIDGKRYYFGEYGASSGRIYIEGKQYYFDSDTCELKIGWLELGNYKYYADPNDGGALASNKTLIIDGVSYTFDYGGTLINNVP